MTADDRLTVEVLGPIRLLDPAGRDVTPDGVLQRRLLALLVLHRGRVVPADVIVDALWPARPPQNPVAALQNHLSRLRRALPEGLIDSVADGYRLDPDRIVVDADRLVDLVADGPTATPSLPAELDAVLACWHGPAYPELDDIDAGRAEAMRLHDLGVRARELRAEHRLARGETDGLVAEVAALVEAEPLRERPRSLLMATLAATGRVVEALRVYDDYRRLLSDELGVEPSPSLTAQHADLLRGTAAWPPRPASRLPAPLTALVGREVLVGDLDALVAAHRLVTLVGPGGVGKTRLLVELGHRLQAASESAVVLCELAAADAESVAGAVAASLAIDARPGSPLDERLAEVLGDADVVLLLDNCEHVLDPTARLVELLLLRCPRLRIVATSRERLRLPGEHVRVVPPLAAGDEHAPAVQLFVERARAVQPGFDPDADGRARIVEVVRRLDGLPLAIELAAARLHTFDLDEVASGLDHRFALLSSGSRTSARHASLRAAVSWSFGLLDTELQEAFADLSVFSGTFSAADAAAVCGIADAHAVAVLAQLVERSLVMRAPDQRYVLLETLRAFAAEQLAARGRAEVAAERHARHQVAWLEDANRRLLLPGQRVLGEIDRALPELRTALGWLLDHGDVELAGRFVAGLFDYGFLRLRPDVLAWAERVIDADPGDESPWAPLSWVIAAYVSWMAGDVAETGERTARAMRLAEQAGDEVPALVLSMRGNYELFHGRLTEAAAWYRRAFAARGDACRRLMAAGTELLALGYAGDPQASARATALLDELGDAHHPYAAYVWFCAGEAELGGDVALARARLARAVELAESTEASCVVGLAGASKASIDARVGDPLAAAEDYRRLIDHWRRAGMWATQWTMLRSIAGLLARLGRERDAAVLEGAVRATRAGHRIFGADAVALNELSTRLRATLGDAAYEAALADGAVLDGDAAAEHALRALGASALTSAAAQ